MTGFSASAAAMPEGAGRGRRGAGGGEAQQGGGELLGRAVPARAVVGGHLDQQLDRVEASADQPELREDLAQRGERQQHEVVALARVRALVGEDGRQLVRVEQPQRAGADDDLGERTRARSRPPRPGGRGRACREPRGRRARPAPAARGGGGGRVRRAAIATSSTPVEQEREGQPRPRARPAGRCQPAVRPGAKNRGQPTSPPAMPCLVRSDAKLEQGADGGEPPGQPEGLPERDRDVRRGARSTGPGPAGAPRRRAGRDGASRAVPVIPVAPY